MAARKEMTPEQAKKLASIMMHVSSKMGGPKLIKK